MSQVEVTSRQFEILKSIEGFIDPKTAVTAFAEMMKNTVTLPARFMTDGEERDFLSNFSDVVQRIGGYNVKDSSNISDAMVKEWKIESVERLSDASAKAKNYLCTLLK